MADNIAITAGAGTTIASDDVGGVHYQVCKLAFGALDTATLVTTSAGFPVQQQGTWNVGTVTTITNVVHVDDNAGSLTVDAPVATPVFVRLSDGSAAIATLPVSLASVPSHPVTNVGVFAVQAATAGDVAADGVDSGNPVKVGMRALAHGTNPTAVAAADRTDWLANRAGVPWVICGHPNIQTVRLQFTAAQTDVAIVTVATGLKIVVTALTVTLDNASTVFPLVRIGFGTANTPTTTGVIAAHGGVPAGGGFSRGDGSGIIGIGADNEDLRITTVGVATGNGVEVIVTYYTIES